jgi:hypothetical protein
LRHFSTWTKANAVESANRIHEAAIALGAHEVRVDGTGLGAPVVDMLAAMAGNHYTVISIVGGAASPDNTRWLNARAYGYDNLREKMMLNQLDIDIDDKTLLDEMMVIKYKFSPKGAIQIESKDDMRGRGLKSPDRLDAAMYASLNLQYLTEGPYKGMQSGDKIYQDPSSLDAQFPFYSQWSW